MAETVNLKEFKIKSWIKEKVDKGKKAAKATIKWASENPTLALACLGALTATGNKAYRAARDHHDEVIHERRYYDPRRGKYSTARRNLRNWEKEEIDKRYSNGESYQQILMSMDLLK